MKYISIIVPVYNVEKYIDASIESILNQSYRNFELILVNDGSTDSSKNICIKYLNIDDRIIFIDKTNGGLSSARNAGLNVAKGDYICFIDSDDVIAIDMIFHLSKALDEFDINVAECGIIPFIDTPVGKKYDFEKPVLVNYENYPEDDKLKDFFSDSVCNKIFRRCIFEKLRFPEIKRNEDSSIIADIFMRERTIAVVPYGGYFYRSREGSIMRSSFCENDLILIEILKKRIEKLEINGYHKVAKFTNARLLFELLYLYYKARRDHVSKDVYMHIEQDINTLCMANKKNPFLLRKTKLMAKVFTLNSTAYYFLYTLRNKIVDTLR